MKQKRMILISVIAVFLLVLTSCQINPQELPEMCIDDILGQNERIHVFDAYNGRNAEVSFPDSSSIVLTVEGIRHEGTFEKDKSAKDIWDSYYVFSMNDGTTGTLVCSMWGGWDKDYSCDITYQGLTYHFAYIDHYYLREGKPFSDRICEAYGGEIDWESQKDMPYDEWAEWFQQKRIDQNLIPEIRTVLETHKDITGQYIFGTVVRRNSKYCFVPEGGEAESLLFLDYTLFYRYTGENLTYSDSVSEGKALLVGTPSATQFCAIYYIPE